MAEHATNILSLLTTTKLTVTENGVLNIYNLVHDQEEKTIFCNVTGAIPAANLKWTLDGEDVTLNATTVASASGDIMASTFKFVPRLGNADSSELICSAENEATRKLKMEPVSRKMVYQLPAAFEPNQCQGLRGVYLSLFVGFVFVMMSIG